MNRKQAVFAFLAVAIMGVSGAAQAEPYNRYMTFQGALSEVDGYDSGISGIATYGVRVPEMHKNFSVEGEFTKSLVKPEGKVGGTTHDLSYYTLGAYGVYSQPLSEKFHLRGRLGVLYEHLKWSTPASSETDGKFKLSYGLGITVGLTKESRFILEYTVIESHIDHISAGLQFKL